MALLYWDETDRETLTRVLPDALVVLPIGATEQHGPHLPTCTDALIVGSLARAAAERAAEHTSVDVVVAPVLPFGSSDHHFPYGGTLSLTPETMTAVITDVARSVGRDGGRRVVVVNGHGGNHGPGIAAAAAVSTRHDVAVAYVDYWSLLPASEHGGVNVPGHAGAFETSMMLRLRPELVRELPTREAQPGVPAAPDVTVSAAAVWHNIDGFTDRPMDADAEAGKRWFESLTGALADRLVTLAEVL